VRALGDFKTFGGRRANPRICALDRDDLLNRRWVGPVMLTVDSGWTASATGGPPGAVKDAPGLDKEAPVTLRALFVGAHGHSAVSIPTESPLNPTHNVRERPMPFIDIRVIEGVFTAEEKREMVERVSEAVIAIEGEALRPLSRAVITETPSGEWAVGESAKTADDVKALRSAAVAA
jgi:4-oxalocrotonate tautomerase